MNLGNNLFNARKKKGLSQEEIAEKLGVSRQTISKWELNETIPDIYQAKKMSRLYDLKLDELVEISIDLKEIEKMIEKTDENQESKINWTNVWGKKYPVLNSYKQEVDVEEYSEKILDILNDLKCKYNFNNRDCMLILKDILYNVWKKSNR